LGWSEGPAEFGYGDGGEATIVSYGPQSSSKYVTTYFRKSFSVSNPRATTKLIGTLVRDDGAVVYINGMEVYRNNMPQGGIVFSTWASSAIGGGDESAPYEFEIDPSVLVAGANVAQVEIHQANAGSTDLSFAMELKATTNPFNQPPQVSAGSDLAITLPDAAQLSGVAADDALPNPPGVFTATWTFVSGPGSVSFGDSSSPRTTASFSLPGDYVLRLSVADGELTVQDEVKISVAGQVDPLAEWKGQHFSGAELDDPAISGNDADPDGDGCGNLEEFLAGTDPRDGNSYLHVQSIVTESDEAVLKFSASPERSYSIQAREALGAGSWLSILDLSPQSSGADLVIRDPVTPERQKRFYRVVTPQQRNP
jgi:hypothetical protein